MKKSLAYSLVYPLRMLRQDWRAGELRVLFFAVIVAVASITSVSFFTDRVQRALEQQANSLLGADLVVSSDHALAPEFIDKAKELGLEHAQTQLLFSMASLVETAKPDIAAHSQMVGIKAVTARYPLRGELRLSEQRFAPDYAAEGIPEPGTIWVDPALLSSLQIDTGAFIKLGEAAFRITAVISSEPDRGMAMFNVSPRVIMNQADVSATNLIQIGSRVRYGLLIAGDMKGVDVYQKFASQHKGRGESIRTASTGRPEVTSALDRSRYFFGLSGLVCLLLSGIAIITSARRFVLHHLDNCAIMRCVGATQALISRMYIIEMLYLGVLASMIGCVIGYSIQHILTQVLATLISAELPGISLMPLLTGIIIGTLTLLSFAMPVLQHLRNVPTLRVLRREMGMPAYRFISYLPGIVLLIILSIYQAGDLKLGVYALSGIVATLVCLALAAVALVYLLKLINQHSGILLRYSMAGIVRRGRSSVIQVVAFGIGLMVLLLLTVVQSDLMGDWRDSLPDDTPNRFLINIQADQIEQLAAFFQQENRQSPVFAPMVKARLVSINDRNVSPDDYENGEARRLLNREFNLSWAESVQPDNEIVAGKWWGMDKPVEPQFSVEEEVARELGVAVGDVLTYTIAGRTVKGTVSNLRKVDWGSFGANFYVIASPGLLDGHPTSYISSIYITDQEYELLNRMIKQFTNITIIDIAAIMTHIRSIIDKVSQALQYVFIFTLAAGLLVLFAAVQATLDERMRETTIMRTLGASRHQLFLNMLIEFGTIGLLAGLIASVAASAIGRVLAERVFHFSYVPDASLWMIGILTGITGAIILGFIGTRKIIAHPPLQNLREMQGI